MNKRVLLVSAPFGWVDRPALGISILKAVLDREAIPCDIRYLNLTFAEMAGYEDYTWIASQLPYPAFAGDWTFNHLLYGERPQADRRYLEHILRTTWQCTAQDLERVLRVRSLAHHFIEHSLASVPWSDYGIVGFTSTFEQNMASLALARRIKRAHPGTAIVFGGANWEAEMGVELHERFRFVDYVCSGEAEHSFPALVKCIFEQASGERNLAAIPGIVYRSSGRSVSTGPPSAACDLDSVPVPDFADYFRALDQSTVASQANPTLLFETSRGCWWGAKTQCAFCGLNGGGLAFRSKSPERALAELNYLVGRWRIPMIEAVDNIIDMRYFRDVLPTMAREGRHAEIFYEVKANLSRRHLELLRDARVRRIQPGIESLSDHVLGLMRKGTTALRNIQLLKWCKEYGILAHWNLLYGFPGETREDYRRILELLPAINFLGPPTGWGPIRLDRFSPYFRSAAQSGFTNIRPFASYQYLYPFPAAHLSRLAYSFEYSYEPAADPGNIAEDVIRYLEQWKRDPDPGCLWSQPRPGGTMLLTDSRRDARKSEVALSPMDSTVYRYCDEARSLPAIAKHLRDRHPDVRFSDGHLARFLESLVANRLMVTDGSRYLALAISSEGEDYAAR